jgi:hypothetical protein
VIAVPAAADALIGSKLDAAALFEVETLFTAMRRL